MQDVKDSMLWLSNMKHHAVKESDQLDRIQTRGRVSAHPSYFHTAGISLLLLLLKRTWGHYSLPQFLLVGCRAPVAITTAVAANCTAMRTCGVGGTELKLASYLLVAAREHRLARSLLSNPVTARPGSRSGRLCSCVVLHSLPEVVFHQL